MFIHDRCLCVEEESLVAHAGISNQSVALQGDFRTVLYVGRRGEPLRHWLAALILCTRHCAKCGMSCTYYLQLLQPGLEQSISSSS